MLRAYIAYQEKEIEVLKTTVAKNRRYENIIKTGCEAIHIPCSVCIFLGKLQ